jgi:hypothetical protein
MIIRPPRFSKADPEIKHFKTRRTPVGCEVKMTTKKTSAMKLKEQIKERAATGYILLWLLGIPIPVLLLFFLLRGCT